MRSSPTRRTLLRSQGSVWKRAWQQADKVLSAFLSSFSGSKEYDCIDLDVKRGRSGYEGGIEFPLGQAMPIGFEAPFSLDDLRQLLDQVREEPANARAELEEIGGSLFRAVFAGEARALFRISLAEAQAKGTGLRLRLRLDPETALWPWEYLNDDGYFLGIDGKTPIVRHLDVLQPIEPLPVHPPLRVLFLAASPIDRMPLDGEGEWKRVREALAPLIFLRWVKLDRLDHPTLEDLDKKLSGKAYHVLHFVGHGGFDEKKDVGAIVLLDGRGGASHVDGGKLSNLLTNKPPSLIVLNACDGARGGVEDSFSGIAQALIRRKVPAVAAMQFPVYDDAAIEWAAAFYRALTRFLPVDAAVALGRRALFRGDHQAEWGTPVIYLRARTGRLFEPRRRILLSLLTTLLLVLGVSYAVEQHSSEEYGPAPQERFHLRPAWVSDPACPPLEGLDMAFVRIKASTFSMGSTKGEKKEEPVHEVTITRDFCLGRFEVTRAQWARVMGNSPGKGDGELPVTGITWNDAHQFLKVLTRERKNVVFRLPSEAEWELAARSGASFGETPVRPGEANCVKAGRHRPVAVGLFPANPWGLYDMLGNAAEWIEDSYRDYEKGAARDPKVQIGKKKVRRGGSFNSRPTTCRSTSRSAVDPGRTSQETGLRILREIASPPPDDASKPETTPHHR